MCCRLYGEVCGPSSKKTTGSFPPPVFANRKKGRSPRRTSAIATTLRRGLKNNRVPLCQVTLSIGPYLLLKGTVPTLLYYPGVLG